MDHIRNKTSLPTKRWSQNLAPSSETTQPWKHKIPRLDNSLTSLPACTWTCTLASSAATTCETCNQGATGSPTPDPVSRSPRPSRFSPPEKKTCFLSHCDSVLNSFLCESRARRSQTMLGQGQSLAWSLVTVQVAGQVTFKLRPE